MPKVNYNAEISNEIKELFALNNARYNVYLKNKSNDVLYCHFVNPDETIDSGIIDAYDFTIEDGASIFLIVSDPFEIQKKLLVFSAGTGTVECACSE